MSQPTCEPLVEAAQKLAQDLDRLEAQLYALEVEGMNQLHCNHRLIVSTERNSRFKTRGIAR